MKKMIALYIALIAAIYVGLHIQQDPGYVLFAKDKWTVEMPLWFFVIALITTLFLIHYSLNFFYQLGRIRFKIRSYIKRSQYKASHSKTKNGLISYSEGNWYQAEKFLLKGLPSSDSPLINYLIASRAAQEQGKTKQRDVYLREAEKTMPDAKVAVLLTQAELQLQAKQFEQANATLSHLATLVPKHPHVLKLMLSLYEELQDWQSLATLLPKLSKLKIISSEKANLLQRKIFSGYVDQIMMNDPVNTVGLLQIWQRIPGPLQKDFEFVSYYAKKLIEVNESDFAEGVLKQSIKKSWHEELILLYGDIKNSDFAKQLKFSESYIRSQPNSANLFLTMGKLAKKLQLWGKSKNYLKQSITIQPSATAYFELGELYQTLGVAEKASEQFQAGLTVSI